MLILSLRQWWNTLGRLTIINFATKEYTMRERSRGYSRRNPLAFWVRNWCTFVFTMPLRATGNVQYQLPFVLERKFNFNFNSRFNFDPHPFFTFPFFGPLSLSFWGYGSLAPLSTAIPTDLKPWKVCVLWVAIPCPPLLLGKSIPPLLRHAVCLLAVAFQLHCSQN